MPRQCRRARLLRLSASRQALLDTSTPTWGISVSTREPIAAAGHHGITAHDHVIIGAQGRAGMKAPGLM